ncbi:hypothetical protein ACHAXS_003756 [Conticribra weissflogii]
MSRLPCHKGLRSRPEQYLPLGVFPGRLSGSGMDIGSAHRVRQRPPLTFTTEHRDTKRKNNIPPKLATGEIPYVSHDDGKTRYYADRFYLDAPTALLEYQLAKSDNNGEEKEVVHCNKCGETIPPHLQNPGNRQRDLRYQHRKNQLRQGEAPSSNIACCPRPLFDRAAFINSLDLSAAIIATYTVDDLDNLSESFPKLFPPPENYGKDVGGSTLLGNKSHDHVPTLILHGQKGFTLDRGIKPGNMSPKQTQHQNQQPEAVAKNAVPKKSPDREMPNEKLKSNKLHSSNKIEIRRDKSLAEVIIVDCDSKTNNCDNNRIETSNVKLPCKSSNTDNLSDETIKTITFSENPTVENSSISNDRITPPLESPSNKVSEVFATIAPPVCHRTIMQPIFYESDDEDSGFDDDDDDRPKIKRFRLDDAMKTCAAESNVSDSDRPFNSGHGTQITTKERNGNNRINPTCAFGGEVFFTQILPQWCPPTSKAKKKKQLTQKSSDAPRNSDNFSKENRNHKSTLEADITPNETEKPEMKYERGVHHPKYFLLFEKCGSLVVIVSTCNLTSQTAVDASWVQRFWPKCSESGKSGLVDMGMPSDFGVVLADFLEKQSEAAKNAESMLPDLFLKQFVNGLSLSSLASRYQFEEAQVHLISTVPGDYSGCLPHENEDFNASRAKKQNLTYGPQRVAFILSRLLNESHIHSARIALSSSTTRESGIGMMRSKMEEVLPWLPPALVSKMERLVIQPTSFGGTWTGSDMEVIVRSYLRPHWKKTMCSGDLFVKDNNSLGNTDIVWPTFDYFDAMRERRRELQKMHPNKPIVSKRQKYSSRGDCHVFLSSLAFSKLDRSCISRMVLYQSSLPPQLPFETASLHFKSICRLLSFEKSTKTNSRNASNSTTEPKLQKTEYLSWFMLTSACLSRGAQGQPTPNRGCESDSISYSNFELGVLFCSRLLGDQNNDRLYIFEPQFEGCHCGKGKRWYKDRLRGDSLKKEMQQGQEPSFIESVRKVHLPIPYHLRPMPYQEDPDSDFLSFTPYLHEVPDGSGHVGNMKLTPLGQRLADETCL